MKFYKNSYLTYNVTFNNPVSWILAYCYALASVDFKLFTQWAALMIFPIIPFYPIKTDNLEFFSVQKFWRFDES